LVCWNMLFFLFRQCVALAIRFFKQIWLTDFIGCVVFELCSGRNVLPPDETWRKKQ
jgi:hypothetical protein